MLRGSRFALLACALPALAQQPSRGVNWYSVEKEAALGLHLAADFRSQHSMVDDDSLKTYLSAVTARLNQFAQSQMTIAIEVVASPGKTGEAIGLPGGHLFVPLSLLISAHDEAELAGTLAHVLAHIAARHGTKQATRGEIVNLATIPLIFFGFGGCGDDSVLIPTGFMPFRRRDETEADQLAIEWMTRAGYAPAAWAAYLERVKPQSLLPLAERIASIMSAPPPVNAIETGGFPEAQARARAITPPPKPDQPPTLRRRPKADEP